MEFIFIIGRILLGGYFIMAGLNHFKKKQMMIGYAQSHGIKSASALVALSGLLLLAGGLGILLGVFTVWAIWALVIFLVLASFMMHSFWKAQDSQQKMADMQHFMKNMALAGALLMLLELSTPWVLSIF